MKCYLRMGSDTIFDVKRYASIKDAEDAYREVAEDLARFDQQIDATIHIANNRDELVEDADYHLALGPRGGLVRTRA